MTSPPRLSASLAPSETLPFVDDSEPTVFSDAPCVVMEKLPGAARPPTVRPPCVSVMVKALVVPTKVGANTPPLKSCAAIE